MALFSLSNVKEILRPSGFSLPQPKHLLLSLSFTRKSPPICHSELVSESLTFEILKQVQDDRLRDMIGIFIPLCEPAAHDCSSENAPNYPLFLRKQESRIRPSVWIPACAGMTLS